MKCPNCKSEALKEDNKSWPFCSSRCKEIDFGKWVKEEYKIAGKEGEAVSEVLENIEKLSSESE